MKKGLVLAIVAGMLLSLTGAATAGSHSWYFSQSGNDIAGDGSMGNPWKSLSKAKSEIDKVDKNEIVNLYFKRGDVWSFNTAAVSTRTTYGIKIGFDNPVVNINAYGTGSKPKFYGGVSDFSIVPNHNEITGPFSWSNIFNIIKDNCSIKNIHIDGCYGMGVNIGSDTQGCDNFTLDLCDITNFGETAIRANTEQSTQHTTISNNLVHTGQQLIRFGKLPATAWGAGITLNGIGTATGRSPVGNVVKNNVVYDIAGEGIHAMNTVEYNIVGDTGSVGIYAAPWNQNAADVIFRYNLVVHSDYASSIYDNLPNMGPDGIGIADEAPEGINSDASVEVYGNIVINRMHGIFIANYASTSPWKEVRMYNNTVIDSLNTNYAIAELPQNIVTAGKGYFYNNASILYDRPTGVHAADWGNPSNLAAYWTIDNNAFWTEGSSPVVDTDWRTNMITTDPKLPGEPAIDWDGQSGATYYKDIKFSDLYQPADSSLVGAGKTPGDGFDNKLLTKGTKWSDSPGITAQLAEQSAGDWDVGASKYSVVPNADINNDGKVNLEDFAVLSVWWDDENACSPADWCGGADFDMSGTIDMFDLGYFTENWLR